MLHVSTFNAVAVAPINRICICCAKHPSIRISPDVGVIIRGRKKKLERGYYPLEIEEITASQADAIGALRKWRNCIKQIVSGGCK